MDVSCPACAAKYTADEEKLRGKTARMRCKACNTAWLITGPGASSAPNAAPVSIPPASMGSSPPPSMKPASMRPPTSAMPVEFPKSAAVVKKGGEREKRDLFAERPLDEGSVREGSINSQVKDTVLPPPSYGFNGTGSRNENSVLFRVDQLTGAGRIKTPEPMQPVQITSQPPMRGDEEGVIDLKALSSGGTPRQIVPVAPLFSEPPPMTMEVGRTGSHAAVAKPISKAKLFGAIAAAAAFLIIAGLGISVVFKGEEAVARTAPAAAPPPPAPSVTAAPTQTADPAAASGQASNDDSASTPKGKKGKRGKGKGGNASASSTPKAPKAADPCGCHGDFNCVLACTAKNGH